MKRIYVSAKIAVVIFVSMLVSNNSSGQLKGIHALGDFGLASGTQTPPSLIAGVPLNWYSASKLINSKGESVNAPDLNVFMTGIAFSAVSNVKILNANYGANLSIPFVSNRLEGNYIQAKSSLSFSDMYVQPLQLGWRSKRADFMVGYGIYMPTGKYEYGGSDNKGLGMWTHEFSGGTTLYLDPKKTFNFSTTVFFETHSEKKDATMRVGNIMTMEGGFAKTFYKKLSTGPIPMIFNVGPIYYMQFKVSDDKIPVGNLVFTGDRDHIYAFGLEGNLLYPKTFTSLSFRWLGEVEAHNRFQGNTFFITIGQFLKSFEKKAKQ